MEKNIFKSPRIVAQMGEAKRQYAALFRSDDPSAAPIRPVAMLQPATDHQKLRIKGMSRFWGDAASELHTRMQQILSGLHTQLREFTFCISGDEAGISCHVGAADAFMPSLKGAFDGLLEDVAAETVNQSIADLLSSTFPSGRCYGGVITGMPGLPDEKGGIWTNPASVIAAGMQGQRFMLVAFCKAVDDDTLQRQISVLHDRQSDASFNMHLTLPGNELNPVSQTVEIRDYKRYSEALDRLDSHLMDAQAGGAWSLALYVLSDSEENVRRLASLSIAALSQKGADPEPLRYAPSHSVYDAVRGGGQYMAPCSHPLNISGATGFSSRFTTQLSSRQLAAICILPDRELPGFFINDPVRFDQTARRVYAPSGRSVIKLGNIVASPYNEKQVGEYLFDAADFDRHALVVGATGGGKSNTIRSLLKTLNDKCGIPFMVIESAKSEYWQLSNLGLNVSVLQLGAHDAPFRLNPFECIEGFPLQTHVDALLSTFKAAFEMYPPMPFILEQSVYAVYHDYGWDVATGKNSRAIKQYPTLSDLYWQIPITVESSAYDKEIKDNVTGSLQTRIRSLIIGGKGGMMDCRSSTPLSSLLNRALVLELENLGDDDTKAFVIGLLMTQLYELRRTQSAGLSKPFSHLLIIEEAHRLLKRVSADGENGNPRAAAVEFFCNMLSEIRSYGQGILIADQSPQKLAQDAVRNTNLKIVHRIVDADDREAVAGAMHMNEEQREAITMLGRGVAAVYAEGDHRPRLVKMPLMKPAARAKSRDVLLDEARRDRLFAALPDAASGPYETCRFCGFFRSGRCANEKGKAECMAYADPPLDNSQQRAFYQEQIRSLGPNASLMSEMIAFAVEYRLTAQGKTAEEAAAFFDSLSADALICMAGRSLIKLGLEKKLSRLFADRYANSVLKKR